MQAFDFDTEVVMNKLLEGSLPPELSALDPQMPLSGGAGPSAGPGSGAGPSHAAVPTLADGLGDLSLSDVSWTGLRANAEVGAAAGPSSSRGPFRGVSGREASSGNKAHRVSNHFPLPSLLLGWKTGTPRISPSGSRN